MDIRTGVVIVLLLGMLAGCVKAGKVPPPPREEQLARFLSEGATRADLERQLDTPTAVQLSEATGRKKESWAYGYAQLGANPARFVPLFGAFAVADVKAVEPSSFAVTFSDDGQVEGFTQRRLARHTIDPAPAEAKEPVTLYGERNLVSRPWSAPPRTQ